MVTDEISTDRNWTYDNYVCAQHEKNPSDMCAKWRLKLACAYAQSNQRLRCQYEETFILSLSKMRPVKIQISLCDAQADLNFRWAYISEGTFSDVSAYML